MGCVASKEARPHGTVPETNGDSLVSHTVTQKATDAKPAVATIETVTAKEDGSTAHIMEQIMKISPKSPLEALPGELGEKEEARRLKALLDCRMLDTPPEKRFDTICSLVQNIFQVPIAVVGLIDTDRLFLKSLLGYEGTNAKRIHSFCDASLKAPHPTMMIVPDTLQDARFTHNEFVSGKPFVRFYCGAPLISSEGYVLGSLGMMDVKPRYFPAELCNVICNFAELVVRELEKDKAEAALAKLTTQGQEHSKRVLDSVAVGAVRRLSVFNEAVMLCDTSVDGWAVLYCNGAWCDFTGMDETACLQSNIGELLSSSGNDIQLAVAQEAIKDRRPFMLRARLGKRDTCRLRFRPATNDHLGRGGAMPLIGIPNFMEPATGEELQNLPTSYYFAVVEELNSDGDVIMETPDASERMLRPRALTSLSDDLSSPGELTSVGSSGAWSVHSFDLAAPAELGKVVLGPMLGSGGYGRVYRGNWCDQVVAIKILDTWEDPPERTSSLDTQQVSGPALEAVLSRDLSHPNIVRTLDFAFSSNQGQAGVWAEFDDNADGIGKEHRQCWIVQEYANHGTLLDAVDRGWLRSKRTLDGPVDMRALLLTARDIVSGVAFIHANSVLHGDLSGNNVLLASAPEDPRGFVAKVGDFGLARVLGAEEQIKTNTYGTVSHMPPELLERGLLGKATDVYSVGVLMWEMFNCQHSWCGQRPTQIFHRKVALKEELQLPAHMPPALKAIMQACLSPEPELRPTCEELLRLIEEQLAELGAVNAGGPVRTEP